MCDPFASEELYSKGITASGPKYAFNRQIRLYGCNAKLSYEHVRGFIRYHVELTTDEPRQRVVRCQRVCRSG